MNNLRNHKLSMYHELKTVILPDFGFIETITGEELAEYTEDSLVLNTYQFSHDNVAYADPSGRIDPSGVVVYDAGRELDLSEFSVNYVLNTVTLDATPSGTVSADYTYWPITVKDAFPDSDEFEVMELPIVTIDFDGQQDSVHAIGQMQSRWKMHFFIDIFALNDGMRMDIMDAIQRSLKKWIPILDFEEQPLSYDGTLNEEFDWEGQFIYWMKLRDQTRGQLLNLGSISQKERWRASINGAITSIH